MKEWSEEDRRAFGLIEEALRAEEVAEVPPGLAPTVMERVQAMARPPRFYLTWLDAAVSLFVAAMAALVVLVSDALPPALMQRLRLEELYWLQRFHYDLLSLRPAAFLAALLGVVVFAVLAYGVVSKSRVENGES